VLVHVEDGDVGREDLVCKDQMLVMYDKCGNVFMVLRRERCFSSRLCGEGRG